MQAPVWCPFAMSKEKVTGGAGPVNLDTAQQTNRVLPRFVDENIHYRIIKFLYGAKNQQWNMRAYQPYVPVVYGVWHAYKFVVTHTFRVFWPILTYLREGLLRSGSINTIIPKADSYGKNYCCADACHTQDTTPISSQGTGCNFNRWS